MEWQADYKCDALQLSQRICALQQGRIAALRFCDVGFSKLGDVVSRVNWASCRWRTHVILQTCNLAQVVISTITALSLSYLGINPTGPLPFSTNYRLT